MLSLLPDPASYALFMGAAFVLLVTPGPAVLYIVSRGIAQGTGAGLVSALGLVLGGLVHVLAAVLGLSAVLAASDTLYSGFRLAGAAYLVYLGVRQLRASGRSEGGQEPPPASRGRIFRQGVAVSVLNPKPALFFMAFLPQFVDPARGPASAQLLLLGLSFLALALVTDTAWAVGAGRVGGALRHERFRVMRDRTAGAVYVGLGLAAAWGDGLGRD